MRFHAFICLPVSVTSEMKTMKITIGQQALSMLLTLLLVSVVLVPVVSAEGMQNFDNAE